MDWISLDANKLEMKAILLIIIGIVVTSIVTGTFAYGLVMPMTTQEVLDGFDLILLGTITDKKQFEGKDPVYVIEVEEIVKKPDSFGMPKSVSVIGCAPNRGFTGTPCPSYDVGDRGLFLLVASENYYEVSFYSQVSEPHCTSEQFLANYRGLESDLFWTQDRQSEIFFTGKPIDIHYTVNNRDMKEKDYSIVFYASSGKFVYSDMVNGTVNECVGSKIVTTSFVPTVMGTYGFGVNSDEGGLGLSGMSIIDYGSTPLEQYKAGIHGQDIWCQDGLLLVLKHDDTPNLIFDNKPSCVKPDTLSKLAERNVIELSSFYDNRPLIERLYAGMATMQSADLPIVNMSIDYEQFLSIQINNDERESMPNTQEYYERIIREIIPFNVPITVSFGKF